jgi:hypothetical protein
MVENTDGFPKGMQVVNALIGGHGVELTAGRFTPFAGLGNGIKGFLRGFHKLTPKDLRYARPGIPATSSRH